MSKINLEVSISSSGDNEIYKGNAILNSNGIFYNDEGCITNIFFDEKNVSIKRENDDYKYIFEFKKDEITRSNYCLKKLNRSLDFDIKTIRLDKGENSINIIYELYIDKEKTDKFNFEMKWS